MKNNYLNERKTHFLSSLIRPTKLMKIGMIALFLSTSTINGFVQAQVPTNSMKNVKIEEVFNQIEKHTNYVFLFKSNEIDTDRVVSINNAKGDINKILDEAFQGTNITYRIVDNQIMLSLATENKIKVQGLVKDANGEPLIGVSVIVLGTSTGTITDFDGNFSVDVPEGNDLEFRYVGYVNRRVKIHNNNPLTIVLKEDSKILDEVVVTALGIKREQKALSYNVQQVSTADLVTNKDANFINSLSGKVAGVTVNSSSSGVGGASKVVMRGTKSISGSSNALYVIDGVPMYNMYKQGGTEFDSTGSSEAIADINPEDIESMSVLTGAAAAALYGSEAANGAVVITTKKGKAGSTNIMFTQTTDFLSPFVMPKFQNRYGSGSKYTGASDKSWGYALNDHNNYNYKPKSDFFKTGVVATENLTFSTGTDKNQIYLSASAVNSEGMIPNNSYDRYNFTFRNTTSAYNDRLKVDFGGSYIKQNDVNMINQGIYGNPITTAYLFPRGEDWDQVKIYEKFDPARNIYVQNWEYGLADFSGQNPYWASYRNLRENKKDRYMLNASVSYDILSWLNVSGRVRIDNAVNDFTEKFYATSDKVLIDGSKNGLYGIITTKDKQSYADVLLNINKTFENQISIHANIGSSYSDKRNDYIQVRGPISDKGLPNVFNVLQLDPIKTKKIQGGWHEQVQSIFASAELGYKGAYYLTLTGRNDWPSQLAGPKSNKKSFFYPSIGTSFVLSEIFTLPQDINYLKLRASWASVGTAFPRYLANPTYKWDDTKQIWSEVRDNSPVYNLKPERTNSWEVGLTAKLFDHFNIDLSLYHTKTTNQTFDPKVSAGAGYKKMIIQTGSVQNKGIELALGYNNTWGDFSWSSNYTFSANRNKILELVDNYETVTGEIISKDALDIGGLGKAKFILKKGGTLGDLYSQTELQRDINGDIFIDADGNVNAVNSNHYDIKLGSVLPKANMAWRNAFTYKNISASFMLSARIGGIVYSATQAAMDLYGVSETSADARDAGGVIVNGTDVVDAEKWYSTIGSQSGIPQYYTYSATNVRLQEATIGYTFPRKMLRGIADVTVSLVGRNLLMIYNKAPFDPESVATTANYYQGIDYFIVPNSRNLGFNIRLKF